MQIMAQSEMASPQHTTATATATTTSIHMGGSSPYKYLMSPSQSAPDMTVQGLVDRFNTLKVKDQDEEQTQRSIRRLEAALRRAEMAREEAETEARSLRQELNMQDERQRERGALKERLEEYEKKYDKAKDRFRQQKAKHEEQIKKMSRDYMEREKQHWRQEQLLQEEVEWERKLRHDQHDLVAFLEMERIVEMQSRRLSKSKAVESRHVPQSRTPESPVTQEETYQEPEAEAAVEKSADVAEPQDTVMDTAPEPSPLDTEAAEYSIIIDDMDTDTPNQAEPSNPPTFHDSPQTSPLPKTLTVPINFNDDSDKENAIPRTPARHVSAPPTGVKTPMTVSCATPFSTSHENIPDFLRTPIDREAALKAIRERRGRTKSNGAATMTPKNVRDASAPPLNRSLSVGRKSGRP